MPTKKKAKKTKNKRGIKTHKKQSKNISRKKTVESTAELKITASQIKKEFTEDKVEGILRKGRERGFITYAEILNVFPHIEYNIIFLEDLYGRLEAAGVDVLEGQELLDVGGKVGKKGAKDRHDDTATDSVQMYLREIGRISLLKAEEEKELARRIETGDEDAKNKLAQANLRLVVSIAKKYVGRSHNLTM